MPLRFVTLPPPSPSLSVQPTNHIDFTDISTLWQNLARSTPVTAAGQTILGATDVGSSAVHVGNASAGPTFREGGLNGHSYGEFDTTLSHCLSAQSGGISPDTGSRVFMVVYRYSDAAGTGARYLAAQDGGSGNAFMSHNVFDSDPPDTPQSRINGATGNGDAIVDGDFVAAIGEMIQSGGTDPFEYRFHYQVAHVTGTNTLSSGGGTTMNVGCSGPEIDFFNGDLYEAAFWWNGAIPVLDDLETYVTTKYGLTWS